MSILPRSQLLVLGALSLLTILACTVLVLVVGQSIDNELLGARSRSDRAERPDVTSSDARLLVMVTILLVAAVVTDVFIFDLILWDIVVLALITVVAAIHSVRVAWGYSKAEGDVVDQSPRHTAERRGQGSKDTTHKLGSWAVLSLTIFLAGAAIVNAIWPRHTTDSGLLIAIYAWVAAPGERRLFPSSRLVRWTVQQQET